MGYEEAVTFRMANDVWGVRLNSGHEYLIIVVDYKGIVSWFRKKMYICKKVLL